MSTPASILLKNGVVLIHDVNNHVVPTQADILIKDHKLARIAEDIQPDADTEVVDCADKIISPGFIDTHHHGWQTQLKGRHANQLLMEYMITGNAQAFQFSPKDIFYGQLAGMLEAVSAGTTTLVDHAHLTYSADHVKHAISAAASSGIRSVFCFTPMLRVKHFNPLTFHQDALEPWVMQTFCELAAQGPWADGRVTLGFAFDLFFLPSNVLQDVFKTVKDAGVKTITSHFARSPQLGGSTHGSSIIQMLESIKVLDESFLISHASGSTQMDIELIKTVGARVSSTPTTEMQGGMGRSKCFDAAFAAEPAGLQDHASLGIDCHSNSSGSIISEARLGLQAARNYYNEYYIHQGKATHTLPPSLSVEAAFNLATVKGAEAVRMEKEIGRIEEGYRADLVVFDGLSPSMVGAAQHDPVAAILLHSSPADVDMTIVDGIVRKKNGKLLPLGVGVEMQENIGRVELEWTEVAKEVLKSREKIQKEIEKIDFVQAKNALMDLYRVDRSLFVDEAT